MTRIVKLQAENIKRLRAVEITPDGNIVRITGRNGQGKSSVLDAIAYALGGQALVPSKPIREGEKKARAVVTLDNGLTVERRFTERGTVLEVKNADGAKYGSPQAMIDKMLGALTFDPLGFARAPAREQFETLRRLAGIDTSKIDEGIKKLEAERPSLRAAMRREADVLASMPDDPEAPTERANVRALLDELEEVRRHNEQADRTERKRSDLRREIAALDEKIKRLEADKQQATADLMLLPMPAEPRDETAIRTRIDSAEEMNQRHAAAEKRREQEARATEATEAFEAIEARIQRGREKRAEAIAAATYPVPGLALGDGEVIFNEIPLSQASSAEQLRVSTAVAMAMNPELRVLRIQDGSLLDSTSLAAIAEMASANDYQVWIESVDETGTVGFVIEDGAVRDSDAEAAE